MPIGGKRKGMETEQIEAFLKKGDPYTFALLSVDRMEVEAGSQKAEYVLEALEGIIRRNLSSGMIILRFEEDTYIAFAPFILDKNFLMEIFCNLQQEYAEFIRKTYPDKEIPVGIGCIMGKTPVTMEKLCELAEKLLEAIRKQGKYGYKIMEYC